MMMMNKFPEAEQKRRQILLYSKMNLNSIKERERLKEPDQKNL